MKNSFAISLAFGLGLCGALAAQEALFDDDFSSSSLDSWKCVANAALSKDGPNGAQCVKFSISPEDLASDKSAMKAIMRDIPVASVKGKTVMIACQIKGENLVVPKEGWLGPKVMLHYKAGGKEVYKDMPHKFGCYDWTPAVFSVKCPENLEKAELLIGLQSAPGTFKVANLVVKTAAN